MARILGIGCTKIRRKVRDRESKKVGRRKSLKV